MKYTFQQGGPVENNYDSTDFFNQYLDQLQANQQVQQNQQQQPEQPPVDEETDYIKSLRAQADDEPDQNFTLLQQISGRLTNLEKELNYHQQSLEEQQSNIDWFSSTEGLDYTRNKYDTQAGDATVPVFDKPPIPLPVLQKRQLQAESDGNNYAVSTKGATGAYQFMPDTWQQYKPYPTAKPTDPNAAAQAYTHYMSDLTNQFNGDQRKAVAAYNYGPGNINKLINKYGNNWETHLPTETKNYLRQVIPTAGIHTKNDTVDIQDINKNLLNIVANVSQQFPGLVVTSGTDSTHTANSAHYDGEAVDIGANSSNKQAYTAFKNSLPELQQKYGIRYLDEGNHIHLSLSSKGKL